MSKREFIELGALIAFHMTLLGEDTRLNPVSPNVVLIGRHALVTFTPERRGVLVDYDLSPHVSRDLPLASRQRILAEAKTLFEKALAVVAKERLGISENW